MKNHYLIYLVIFLLNIQLIASEKSDWLKDISESIRQTFPNLEHNPNERAHYRYAPYRFITPLTLAIIYEDIKAVNALIGLGAKANLEGENYMYDVSKYRTASAFALGEILRKAGAPINELKDNETPLHNAVGCRDTELVEYLIAIGADPSMPNAHGYNALELAYFMQKRDIDNKGKTPLQIKNLGDIIKMLETAKMKKIKQAKS